MNQDKKKFGGIVQAPVQQLYKCPVIGRDCNKVMRCLLASAYVVQLPCPLLQMPLADFDHPLYAEFGKVCSFK